MTLLNACIQKLNFPSDVAKWRRAKTLFALLLTSRAIFHLVYTL